MELRGIQEMLELKRLVWTSTRQNRIPKVKIRQFSHYSRSISNSCHTLHCNPDSVLYSPKAIFLLVARCYPQEELSLPRQTLISRKNCPKLIMESVKNRPRVHILRNMKHAQKNCGAIKWRRRPLLCMRYMNTPHTKCHSSYPQTILKLSMRTQNLWHTDKRTIQTSSFQAR